MISIYGFGVTGKAVARFCDRQQIAYCVIEGDEVPSWDQIDRVVISPGIRPSAHFEAECARRSIPILSEVEFAIPWIQKRMIGVTGTNGKSSTVLLLVQLLEKAGISALGCGNLGRPLIDVVDEPHSTLVVELSSFQLERTYTPFLEQAILLNITPNHLDHHPSMEHYMQAKLHIKDLVKEGGKFYRDITISTQILELVEKEKAQHRFHDPRQIAFVEAVLRDLGVSVSLEKELPHFVFPPYRLAYRGLIAGMHVYNDSKSSTPEATLFALDQMRAPTLLIVGGLPKNTPFDLWRDYLPSYVKKVFAFGRAADTIKKTLEDKQTVQTYESLQEAFEAALRTAEKGDHLLFSPGCASWDQFANYRARGEAFDSLLGVVV